MSFLPFDYAIQGGFRTFGPNFPFPYTIGGDFEVQAASATVFVWDADGEMVPSAQRVWTENGWFPSVL